MVAENILVIAEQLSHEEQIRLYKMLSERIKPEAHKRKCQKVDDITMEEAMAFIKKTCFSRKIEI